VPPVVVVVVGDAFVQEAGARAPAVVVVDRNERDVEVDGCSIDVDDGSAVEVVGSDGPVVDVTVLAVPSPAESFTPLPPWAHDPRTANARPASPARHAEPSINAILTECRPQRTRQTGECPEQTQTSRRAARPTAGPGPQPAFVYRNRAENERRNLPPGRLAPTGVRLPGYSGKRTPVRGGRPGTVLACLTAGLTR
jgi:hypothetical protein